MPLVGLVEVDDDDVEKAPTPASSAPVARLRALELEVERVARRLSRRSRRLRAVLEEVELELARVDDELVAIRGTLDGELSRIERVADVADVRTRRGALSIVDGDDAFVHVGLGSGRRARFALEEVLP